MTPPRESGEGRWRRDVLVTSALSKSVNGGATREFAARNANATRSNVPRPAGGVKTVVARCRMPGVAVGIGAGCPLIRVKPGSEWTFLCSAPGVNIWRHLPQEAPSDPIFTSLVCSVASRRKVAYRRHLHNQKLAVSYKMTVVWQLASTGPNHWPDVSRVFVRPLSTYEQWSLEAV
jgi:hypothetical protein